jgi:uncharacterized membrane protein
MTGALLFAVTLVAALGAGLMAGLFFAFSTFVMRALARLPAAQGIAAMNAINTAILNPLFAAVFFGTPLAGATLIVNGLLDIEATGAHWLIAGGAVYVLGGFVVTIAFNIPLNNALAATDPGAADAETLWSRYRALWTTWNHVRTVSCLAATACFIVGLALRT